MTLTSLIPTSDSDNTNPFLRRHESPFSSKKKKKKNTHSKTSQQRYERNTVNVSSSFSPRKRLSVGHPVDRDFDYKAQKLFCSACMKWYDDTSFSGKQQKNHDDQNRYCLKHTSTSGMYTFLSGEWGYEYPVFNSESTGCARPYLWYINSGGCAFSLVLFKNNMFKPPWFLLFGCTWLKNTYLI